MKYSTLFPKTIKDSPKDAESINHKLLVRGGFVDQLMAGSWTVLPLGWRVIGKITNIIREEINKVGGQEMLMPLLHPKDIWNETGRWDKADEVMYKLQSKDGKNYALSFTHEEIVMDLLRKHIQSYKDLPVSVYHFSTKFRNELRAKSGILRGREFMMKDLYSAHATKEDLLSYYEQVKGAYIKIFTRLGFDFRVTEASGGVFTDLHTHEFQVLTNVGEDTIYYCDVCNWSANKEIFEGEEGGKCPGCHGDIKKSNSIEVGNIFPLGTFYAEKMNMNFTDEKGDKGPVWFGSYGIGVSRVMGTLVEVNHDENGIVWPENVAPFKYHLISMPGKEKQAEDLYKSLVASREEVLWDDRDVGAGVKFSDADLIGNPIRLVLSEKNGDMIEVKKRNEQKSILVKYMEGFIL